MNLNGTHFWNADVIMPHKTWDEPQTHGKIV